MECWASSVPWTVSAIAVFANMSGKKRIARFDGARYTRVLLSTHGAGSTASRGAIELRPWEGVMLVG